MVIPAALENQINVEIAKNLKAKIVIEAANGPTTVEAVLGDMVKNGQIKKIGSGRMTRYVKG